jgi:archaellum biogenesis protein FlaJ (TadC family)
VDLSKLTTADRVMGVSGVLLFIFSFFKWFGKDVDLGIAHASYGQSGWSSIFSLLGILVGIAIVVVLVLEKFTTVQLPKLPIPWKQAYMIAGIVCAALVLLQLLVGTSKSGVDLDRKYGVFIGTLAAIGVGVGGFLKNQEPEQGTTPPTSF